jgi:PAS domain S-box-containing protein
MALALLLTGGAVLCRAGLEAFSPGIQYCGILLPALMFIGTIWGRGLAIMSAIAGIAATACIFSGRSSLIAPPLNAPQMALLLLIATVAVVLWAAQKLRRKIEAARAAEARLAEIFRQIPGAAAIVEAPDGRLLLRSARSDEVLGHAPRHLANELDLNTYGGIHPDGRPYATDEYPIARALRHGEATSGEQISYRKPDGSIVDLDVHAGPIRGPDGRVLAAVGMAFDVTERMQAERLLRATASRLQAAIDAGGLGLWELDLATGCFQIDAMMAAMIGMPPVPAQLERPALGAMIHPDDTARVQAMLSAALSVGGAYADECRMVLPSGATIWVVTRGTILPDMQKAIGVISDVTERRQREEALHDALRARDVLMHEADHRIKNSLQLVVSLLRLQITKAESAETKHALRDAMSRVDAVANAHLALQRSADLRTIDIDRMLHDLCTHAGALNPAIDVRCQAGSGLSLDAELAIPLGLIASELLTNALRHAFAPDTSGIVRLTVRRDGGTLSLIVADNGQGVQAIGQKPGLGSAVIANLAQQIGATTALTSARGQGTRVIVKLELMRDTVVLKKESASF